MIYAFLAVGLLIGLPVAIAIIATLLVFMAMGDAPYTIGRRARGDGRDSSHDRNAVSAPRSSAIS